MSDIRATVGATITHRPEGVSMTYVRPRPREMREVREMFAAAQAEYAETRKQFPRGVVAALGWVLGDVATSPAYGELSSEAPTERRILDEERAARDALYKRHDSLTLPGLYCVGVEHALMWVRGVTSDPPA